MNPTFAVWIPFQHLWNYLSNTSLASAVQFLLLSLIVFLVADRSLRKFGLYGKRLDHEDPVADEFVQGLTQLNVGLGLLLTFSGVYGLIAAGGGPGGDWSLLLALGSSALGYSAYAVCAMGTVIDAVAQRKLSERAAVPVTPSSTVPADRSPSRCIAKRRPK